MNSPIHNSEAALAHLGWVRALALSLARDANVAEDVVQEAFLLSIERPPRNASRLGPWLARVTRTLARQEARSSRSRRSREHVVALGADERRSAEPFEVLERGQRQRSVVDAVLALPEPYASTLLYHYLDGLTTSEVAQRMACEAVTVRKRLERGRGMLRERLDGEFGCETENWALGLVLPLADFRAPAAATGAASVGTATLMMGGLMSTKVIGLAGLVLASALLFLARDFFESAEPEERVLPLVSQVLAANEQDAQPVAQLPGDPVASERFSEPIAVEPEVLAGPPVSSEQEEKVVLYVRGLDGDKNPVTTGRVDCFWDSAQRLRIPSKLSYLGVDVNSEVTRIELPLDARSVRVCVSNASFEPSPGVELNCLRTDSDGNELLGLVQREADVPLALPADGPFVYGNIYLDGRLLCPSGLRAFFSGVGQVWVNSITSSYRFGPLGNE